MGLGLCNWKAVAYYEQSGAQAQWVPQRRVSVGLASTTQHSSLSFSLPAPTLTNLFFFLSAFFSWFLLSPVGTPRTSQG